MRYIKRICMGVLVCILALSLIAPASAWAAEEELSIASALEQAKKTNPQQTSLTLQVDRAQVLRDDAADTISIQPTGQLIVDPFGQQMVNNFEQATVNLTTLKKQLESERLRVEKEVIAAYTDILLKSYDIEATKLNIEDMEKQDKANKVALGMGLISSYNDDTYEMKLAQLHDNLTVREEQYEGSIATLRGLLHKSSTWTPVLTSRPIVDHFDRQKLETEFLRATSQSALILGAEASREIERIKIYWPGFDGKDRYLDQIGLNVKELEYEKTKRDLWSTVEQLYHGTDALEQQIVLTKRVIDEKKNDLKVMELKYELGMISLRSLQAGQETLEASQLALENAELDLDRMYAQMASNKANYGYITGQKVYSALDWQ